MDYLKTRFPLPEARLRAIVDEVSAAQSAAHDQMMAEKMDGLRCMSCDALIATPNPSPGETRDCAVCEGYA